MKLIATHWQQEKNVQISDRFCADVNVDLIFNYPFPHQYNEKSTRGTENGS